MASSNETFVGWTRESSGRGTWSIIWSCLTTILLTIWITYHPDIHNSGTWKSLQKVHDTVNLLYNFIAAVGALIVPEGFIYMANIQFFQARFLTSHGFSMQQAYYVCMGGYRAILPRKFHITKRSLGVTLDDPETHMLLAEHIVWLLARGYVRSPSEDKSNDARDTPSTTSQISQRSSRINSVAPVQGVVVDIQESADGIPLIPKVAQADSVPKQDLATVAIGKGFQDPVEHVSVTVNKASVESDVAEVPVLLSDREIELLRKSDGTAKFVVLFQCFWFIVVCITRTANGLPLAKFEILTLSYVVCPFLAYLMWWKKPQNVQVYQVLDLDLTEDEWDELASMNHYDFPLGWEALDELPGPTAGTKNYWGIDSFERMIAVVAEQPKRASWMALIGGWISSGMHFLAWNSDFASEAEQILWKVCSVLWLILPLLMIADSRVLGTTHHLTSPRIRTVMCYTGVVLAVASKIIILVVALMAFRRSPQGIYDTWEISNYFLRFI